MVVWVSRCVGVMTACDMGSVCGAGGAEVCVWGAAVNLAAVCIMKAIHGVLCAID